MAGFVLVAKCGCALKLGPAPERVHVSDQRAPTVWDTSKAAEIANQHQRDCKVHTLSEWNTGNLGNCGGCS